MGTNEMKEDEHVVPKNKEQEAEFLLARLQAQFGDLDVGGFLGGDGAPSDGDGTAGKDDESESSGEEPTAEELLAWQQSQYEIGKMKLEAKKIIEGGGRNNKHKSALQRRRQNKTAEDRRLMREYEANDEANEWEHLTTSPDLGGVTSTFFPTVLGDDLELMGGVNPLLQKLASGDEVLGTKWSRLYSSSDGDGLSFRNLLDKICGYEGPTVLLIGGTPSPSKCVGQIPTQDDRVSLGFYTQDTWIVSTENFARDDDCFLFSLDHNKTNGVQFFRPKARGGSNRYLYCHPSSLATASKKRKDVPNGIRVGGDRLHITESLEECRALAYDDVFEEGDLLCGKCIQSLFYFDIDCIEVWGVGGDEWIADALKAQATSKSIQSANLERARKVNKSHFLDDFQNGLLSGAKSGLFGHRDLVEERCDL